LEGGNVTDATAKKQTDESADDKIALEDRVIATVDADDTGQAIEALRSRGWEVEVLSGGSDAERLEPKQGGLSGVLAKAAAVFGDEMRIIDQIERTLVEGNQVLVVSADSDLSPAVVKVLQDHGALAIWDFGSWTFVKVGSTDKQEEEVG